MYELILFIWFITIFIGFNILNYKKFGILPSISDSHKYWVDINKNYIFLLVTWGYAFPVLLLSTTILIFFSASMLFFTGLAFDYEDRIGNEINRYVHIWSARICVIFSLLSEIIDYKMYVLAGLTIGLILLIAILKIKNSILIIELIAALSLAYCLFKNVVLPAII